MKKKKKKKGPRKVDTHAIIGKEEKEKKKEKKGSRQSDVAGDMSEKGDR